MADRRGLGIVGFCLGGVTAAVMLIAIMVIRNHVDGRMTMESARMPVIATSAQSFIR